jgi:glycosyltransferase involved in cell wall biosynthesis
VKLVVFTPLPPAATGVADYGAALLRALGNELPDWDVASLSSGEEVAGFTPPREPHVLMYHVGNSTHHDFLYPALFRHAGVLVLHDLVLHHARLFAHLSSEEVRAYKGDMGSVAKRDRARARLEAYRAEAIEANPSNGDDVARIALRIGGGRLLYDFPLYEHLVRRSRLTLVHGTTAREEVLERCPGAEVVRVRMGIPIPPIVSREEARRRLGLPRDGLVLASFGLVTPEKRISTALRALVRLSAAGVPATYYLVGGGVPHYDPLAEARALGIAESVRATGRVSEEDLHLYAFASDLCLNLRYPSAGETSATLLRLLACGRPVVVTDQLHVRDFPDTVVARSRLEGDEDGLYCDLLDLVRGEGRRRKLAEAARAFAVREASAEVMAKDYREALTGLVARGL